AAAALSPGDGRVARAVSICRGDPAAPVRTRAAQSQRLRANANRVRRLAGTIEAGNVIPMRKKELAAQALERSGTGRLARRIGRWSGVVTLAYHRIGYADGSPFDRGLWSANPDAFD